MATTLIGISAEGTEDWSNEFVLESEGFGTQNNGDLLSKHNSLRLTTLHELDGQESWDADLSSSLHDDFVGSESFLNEPILDLKNISLLKHSSSSTENSPLVVPAGPLSRLPSVNDIRSKLTKSQSKMMYSTSKSKDTTSDTSSEASEDWDKELGVDEEVKDSQECMINGFRHLMSETLGIDYTGILDSENRGVPAEAQEVKITLPNKCKVVSQLLQNLDEIKVVFYPKPIELYTLKMEGDRKLLTAVELDEWLQKVVSKHILRIESVAKSKDLNWLNKVQAKEYSFNINLVKAWSEAIIVMWRKNSPDLYDVLKKFQYLLKQYCKLDKSVLQPLREMSDADQFQLYSQVELILRIAAEVEAKDCLSGVYSGDAAGARKKYHFKTLFTGGMKSPTKTMTSTNQVRTLLNELIQSTALIFPEFVDHLALLELQAASNHACTMMQHQVDESWSPTPITICKYYLSLFKSLQTWTKNQGTPRTNSKSLKRLNSTTSPKGSDRYSRVELIKTNILCDLYFMFYGFNSLTISRCPQLVTALESKLAAKFKDTVAINDVSDEEDQSSNNEEDANETMGGASESKKSELKELDKRVASILSQMQKKKPEDFSYMSPNSKASLSALAQSLAHSSNSDSTMNILSDLIADDNLEKQDILCMLRNDLSLFMNILLSKYKSTSKKVLLKSKIAFILGNIASTGMVGSELEQQAESMMLESLILLDKLYNSKLNELCPPAASIFGITVMEAFGEMLIKNAKFRFGISCLESAIAAHAILNTREEKKLYRRLTAVAQECGDVKRSIHYHCIMLKNAKDEGKLNEFVYIADLVSKLFRDVGEIQLAERCLCVVSLLHSGYPLQSVFFEAVNLAELHHNNLPLGLELPLIRAGQNIPIGPAFGPWGGSKLSSQGNQDSTIIDSQQMTALLKLVELYVFGDNYHNALNLCSELLKRKLPSHGRASTLLFMAKSFLKLRLLDYCEATLDRLAYETEDALATLYNRPETPGSNDHSIFTEAEYRPIPRYSRTYNEMKKELLSPNTSTQVQQVRQPNIFWSGRSVLKVASKPNMFESKGTNFGGVGGFAASAAVVGFVSKVRSFSYVILRVRSRLTGDDPVWALRWLHIAFSICPRGKWDKIGLLYYLRGKANMALCMNCRDGKGEIAPGKVEEEEKWAVRAEEDFRLALTYYRRTDDYVRQTKVLCRLVDLHVSRVFVDVCVTRTVSLANSLGGKGEENLKSCDGWVRLGLQLAGDTASPLPLIYFLIVTAELHYILGNLTLCQTAWLEAKSLLTITYLQPMYKEEKVSNNDSASSPVWSNLSVLNNDSVPNFTLDVPLPPIVHSPGLLTRLLDYLTRLLRLAFVMAPGPLSSENSALLLSWTRIDHVLSQSLNPLFSNRHLLKKNLQSFAKVFTSQYPNLSASSTAAKGKYRSKSVPDIAKTDGFSDLTLNLASKDSKNKAVTMNMNASSNKLSKGNMMELVDAESRKPVMSMKRKKKSFTPKSYDEISEQLLITILNPSDDTFRVVEDETGGDGEEEERIDISCNEVSLAIVNLLTPFELMRKVMFVDLGTEVACHDGVRSCEDVLHWLRASTTDAISNPTSNYAKIITTRGACPGLTMTSDGLFVEGVVDYMEAESIIRSSNVKLSKSPKDLVRLLENINISCMSSKAQLLPQQTPPAFGSDSYLSEIQGVNSSKSRHHILFMQFKISREQYEKGDISLTDFHKCNMNALRGLAQHVCIGVSRASSSIEQHYEASEVKRSDSLVSDVFALSPLKMRRGSYSKKQSSEAISSFSDDLKNMTLNLKRLNSQVRTLSPMHSNVAAGVYPVSYRFIAMIGNAIFLYNPNADKTSVAILQQNSYEEDNNTVGSVRNLKVITRANTLGSYFDHANGDNQQQPAEESKDVSTSAGGHSSLKRPLSSKGSIFHRRRHSKDDDSNSPDFSPSGTLNSAYSDLLGDDGMNSGSNRLQLPQLSIDASNLSNQSVLNSGRSDWRNSLTLPDYNSNWNDTNIMNAFKDIPCPVEDDREIEGVDYSVIALMQTLGLSRIMFLLTTLLLEESVLILTSPGNEAKMMLVTTGLLRLCRPFKWQHIYIPLMQSSLYPLFRTAVKHNEPFFIGTYHSDLRNCFTVNHATSLSQSGIQFRTAAFSFTDELYLSDITIVDLDRGIIKPGRRMTFASECIMAESLTLEADPVALKAILNRTLPVKDILSMHQKPVLPLVYRVAIHQKLQSVLSSIGISVDNNTLLLPAKFPVNTMNAVKVSECLAKEILKALVALLDGLSCFVKSKQPAALGSMTRMNRTSSFIMRQNDQPKPQVDEFNYLTMLRDDVKPFVDYLFHTKCFEQLVTDVYVNEAKVMGRSSSTLVKKSFFNTFIQSIHDSMMEKAKLYRTLATNRIAGYLITYISTITPVNKEEQDYPFLYQFPYTVGNVPNLRLFIQGRMEQVKVKRRWCVLDAKRFTYYKSRSKHRIKDYINMDSTQVKILSAPTVDRNSHFTTELDACAIIYGGDVFVFRAEGYEDHLMWMNSIRARLLNSKTGAILKTFEEYHRKK